MRLSLFSFVSLDKGFKRILESSSAKRSLYPGKSLSGVRTLSSAPFTSARRADGVLGLFNCHHFETQASEKYVVGLSSWLRRGLLLT